MNALHEMLSLVLKMQHLIRLVQEECDMHQINIIRTESPGRVRDNEITNCNGMKLCS